MNTEILISILIPMYNASQTIQRCLDSLCIQNPRVFEIIIIDDGSNDKSYEIVEHYSKQYTYIHLYEQSNQGVAKTRQNLINYAHGKYILFCDADDYLEQDAIYNIYELIHDTLDKGLNVGAYIFGYNLIRKSGRRTIRRRVLSNGFYEKDVYSRYHVKSVSDLYWSALWNKCYRRDLCNKMQIQFEELMEDVMFNIDYVGRCDKIYISDQVIYNYNQIGESLTRSNKSDSEKDIIDALNAYMMLQSKAIKAYPDYSIAINQDIYCRLFALKKRAHTIRDDKIEAQIQIQLDKYKKYLGIHYLPTKTNLILGNIKKVIRRKIRKK